MMNKNSKIILALGLSCFFSIQEGSASNSTSEQKRFSIVEMLSQLNFNNANDTQLDNLAQDYLAYLHSLKGELKELAEEINRGEIVEALKYIRNGHSSDGRTVNFEEIKKYYRIVSAIPGHNQIKVLNDWLTEYERHARGH